MDLVKDSVFNYKFPFEGNPIDVKQYFQQFSSLLFSIERCNEEKCKSFGDEDISCEKVDCKNDLFYTNFLNISKNELKELKERTSVNHLNCEGEIEPISHEFFKKFDEEKIKTKSVNSQKMSDSSLLSVKIRSEILNIMKNDVSRTFLKYCNYRWCAVNEPKEKIKLNFNFSDCSNILISVKVYYPFLSSRNKNLKIKLLQELHILGNQTLAELKDKILCNLDYISNADVSNECFLKNVGLNLTDKDAYPSSFIFIEDTFYNDTRNSEFVDLSKELRTWASEKGVGSFKSESMENTYMSDLKLRLGRPFVYQHQGNCEHLIVFSDLRFLTFGDPSKLSVYPFTYSTGRFYGKHCMMCAESYARWLVIGNERLTHDKTFLCGKCFFSYNYVNGAKIGQFKAFKYVDPVALL